MADRNRLNINPSSVAAIGDIPVFDGVDWLPSSVTAATPAPTTADTAQLVVIDARYRSIQRLALRVQASVVTGAAVYVGQGNGAVIAQTTAGANPPLIDLDPASTGIGIGLTGRTTKLRLISAAATTDTAAGAALTIGLYPLGTPSGGTTVWNPNLGTVVSGSTVAYTSVALAANTVIAASSSGAFTCPAAGIYCVAIAADGAMTANSNVVVTYRLETDGV